VSDIFFAAIALMLVIEGLLPFFSPGSWRSMVTKAASFTDGQLRFMGLMSIVAGLVLLYVVT
jgi:uncharacterized protein YjeT (DUF2065 family)